MKSMNRKESKKIAVMAAVITGFMMFAFMPAASATVTSFTVEPGTGIAAAVDSYNVLVTTDGVTTTNITIPAGFIAVKPMTGGVQIARVEFWNTSKGDYYGYATITSNSDYLDKVDVYSEMQVGGDEFEYGPTSQNVNYNPGGFTSFEVKVNDGSAWANITLPTETEDGCINITTDCESLDLLQDVHIAIKQFVRNPLAAGDYTFNADGVDATVSITAAGGHGIVFNLGTWFVDNNGDHIADDVFGYGFAGATPLIGDFNQNGYNGIAVFNLGTWFVDNNCDHVADYFFGYGFPGATPLVGDINQDGKDDIAVFNLGTWFVDTNMDHVADDTFGYGFPGATPLVGDFNQDGKDDIAVFNLGVWFVDTNMDHVADNTFGYGFAGATPLVGDLISD